MTALGCVVRGGKHAAQRRAHAKHRKVVWRKLGSSPKSVKLARVSADELIVLRAFESVALVLCLSAAWCDAAEIPHGQAAWVRVATADFEIYTTADEDAGRSLILRLERLRAVLQPILGWRSESRDEWRGDVRDERQKSICIIAFGSRDEFQPYAPINRSVGFFLPGARRDFMVLDGSSAEGRAAAHEYVHLLMARSGFRLPPWLNEGLAELYSNIEDRRSEPRVAVGRYIPGRVLSLRRDTWIGLAGLVAASANSDVFTGAGTVDSAYAESWLLAHMLVLDPRYAKKFPDLLDALQTVETADAFPRIYGKSIAEVEQDLKAYLDVGQSNVRILGDPPALDELPVEVQREADFDGRRALAEMLGNYRGRTEQSRDLYRKLGRDYPQRVP